MHPVDCRRQAAEHRRQDCNSGGEEQHLRIELDRNRGRKIIGREFCHQYLEAKIRQEAAEKAGGRRKQKTLGQELPDQAAAARAQRCPDRDLLSRVVARASSRLRDIRAGNQQQHQHRPHQREEHALEIADRVVGYCHKMNGKLLWKIVRINRCELPHNHIHVGPGCLQAYAGLQVLASDQIQRHIARIAVLDVRMPGVDRQPDVAAVENVSWRHDCHQRSRRAVQRHHRADNLRIAVESRPQPVGHPEDRRRAGRGVLRTQRGGPLPV